MGCYNGKDSVRFSGRIGTGQRELCVAGDSFEIGMVTAAYPSAIRQKNG